MSRPGSVRRWTTVAVVLAALVAVPQAVAALPAHPRSVDVATLLNRVRASDRVAYTSYAESVGLLPLPAAGPLGAVADLLGDRSRLRTWWVSPTVHRVDVIGLAGERDTYAQPTGSLSWDSSERRLRVVTGGVGVLRVPRGEDLLPATLGRRLLGGAAPGEVRELGTERVAGQDAITVEVTPQDKRTLLGRIEVAVEPRTGLPLRVAVSARGSGRATITTQTYDLDLGAPAASALRFTTPPDAAVEQVTAVDVSDIADQVLPAVLPDTLAGLPRRADPGAPGVASYGDGYALLAVVPLRADTARKLQKTFAVPGATAIDEPWGEGVLLRAPLLTALTVARGRRGYVIVGTTTVAVLEQAAQSLAEQRPPLRFGR